LPTPPELGARGLDNRMHFNTLALHSVTTLFS
jgi:hypothetical protein